MYLSPEMIAFIDYAVKGDRDAALFLHDIFSALHFYDDMIDKDQELSDSKIHESFWRMLVLLPTNPFYSRHSIELTAVVSSSILQWKAANELEASSKEDSLRVAFIIRSSYHNLITQCALIVGGMVWATEIAELVSQHAYTEPYENYLDELRL